MEHLTEAWIIMNEKHKAERPNGGEWKGKKTKYKIVR
jgi:hypothetical protein